MYLDGLLQIHAMEGLAPVRCLNNAKEFSDTAMVVITRVGGEGADLPTDVSQVTYEDNFSGYQDFEDGQHYFQLNKTERNMLEMVCSNFEKVVVVYNGANTMELGFVNEYDQIQGALWCPGTGQSGFGSVQLYWYGMGSSVFCTLPDSSAG